MPKRDPHSIDNEPHLRGQAFETDASEAKADRVLSARRSAEDADDERMDHSVYDDPAFSAELAPEAARDAVTYGDWLAAKRAEMGVGESWFVVAAMAIAAGPLSIAGAMLKTWSAGTWGIFMAIIAAPLVEEIMKIALPLWAVERQPWLFGSRVQIAIVSLAGALVFAAIENVMYLSTPDATPGFVLWRWTVCVALHTTCTFIASLGLMRVWSRTWATGKRPDIALAGGYIIAAMVLHGAYNLFAMLLAYSGYQF